MHLPVPSKATIVVRFCPLLYELRKVPRMNSGGRSHLIKLIDLEYHVCDVQSSSRIQIEVLFFILFYFIFWQKTKKITILMFRKNGKNTTRCSSKFDAFKLSNKKCMSQNLGLYCFGPRKCLKEIFMLQVTVQNDICCWN